MLDLSLQEKTVRISGRQFVMRELSGSKLQSFMKVVRQSTDVAKKHAELSATMGLLEKDPESQPAAKIEELLQQAKKWEAEALALEKPLYDMLLNPVEPNEPPSLEWYRENISERIAKLLIEEQFKLNDFKVAQGN